jgi:DegV family protein with EDD domain
MWVKAVLTTILLNSIRNGDYLSMEYKIIADGACDLYGECADGLGIKIVPFYVSFDENIYKKEGEEVGIREFYDEMVNNPSVFPKTSMPSVQDYLDVFEPVIKAGEAIVCICITTKFSGSYNSAVNAKNMILEDYPDAKIEVIDSTLNTVEEGIFVREAARMKADGVSFEECVKTLDRIKSTGRIIFTIGNMDYLIHGGRVGKVLGGAVNMLGIKPMILMKDGEIFSSGVARSRKKSIDKLLIQIKEHFVNNNLDVNKYEIVVGYGYDYEEAVSFRDKVLESVKEYSDISSIDIYQIGATVGVHTGPYPLGVGLLEKYDA